MNFVRHVCVLTTRSVISVCLIYAPSFQCNFYPSFAGIFGIIFMMTEEEEMCTKYGICLDWRVWNVKYLKKKNLEYKNRKEIKYCCN